MLRQQVESFIVADSHGADAGNGGIASGTQDGVPGRTSVLQGVVLAGTRDVIKTPLVVSTVQYLPEIEGIMPTSVGSICAAVKKQRVRSKIEADPTCCCVRSLGVYSIV